MMTMTTQHLGHVAGRARRIAPSSWRSAAAAFRGCGTTGVFATPVSTSETQGNPNVTTTPAATVHGLMTIKRSARHLGPRTT